MSTLPFLVRNIRFGSTLGSSYQFEDYIKKQFIDSYSGLTLEKMAENIAQKHKISRHEADRYSFMSHSKWKAGTL